MYLLNLSNEIFFIFREYLSYIDFKILRHTCRKLYCLPDKDFKKIVCEKLKPFVDNPEHFCSILIKTNSFIIGPFLYTCLYDNKINQQSDRLDISISSEFRCEDYKFIKYMKDIYPIDTYKHEFFGAVYYLHEYYRTIINIYEKNTMPYFLHWYKTAILYRILLDNSMIQIITRRNVPDENFKKIICVAFDGEKLYISKPKKIICKDKKRYNINDFTYSTDHYIRDEHHDENAPYEPDY